MKFWMLGRNEILDNSMERGSFHQVMCFLEENEAAKEAFSRSKTGNAG